MRSGFAYLAICLSGNPRKLVLRTATDRRDGRRLKCAFGCPHPCPLAWVLTWIRLSVLKALSVYVCRMALLVCPFFADTARVISAGAGSIQPGFCPVILIEHELLSH